MSNQLNSASNYLNIHTIQIIDQLNLTIMQKHHVRILFHCLSILKATNQNFSSLLNNENPLKVWCNDQSQKFDDQEFSDILYDQLVSTAKKLHVFSQRIGKNIEDLDIEDLVLLVKES